MLATLSKFKFTIFCLLFIGELNAVSSSDVPTYQQKYTKPHIIMIVADDLGFNDAPWHNPDVVAPTLNALARGGVILEQNYVQPICTPTRSALLSGRYPFTIGRQHDVLWPLMPTGLTLEGPILPQYLKQLGYSTHAVGKWHLGFCKWAYTPTERGFDSFRGYYTGSEEYYTHVRHYYGQRDESNEENGEKGSKRENMIKRTANEENKISGYDFRNNDKPYFKAAGVYSTYEFASRVEEILESSGSDVPKFIYMAFQSVHSPLEVPKNYTLPYLHIKNKARRTYLGMVTAMDEAIGRIIDKLKSSGHYENSVIVFTSDNGGPTITGGNNWPLRGNKTTLWEGGTRANAFVHSPLLTNGGTTSNALFHVTDWLSTLVSLGGGVAPSNTSGYDQWGVLTGAEKPKRNEVIYNIDAYR